MGNGDPSVINPRMPGLTPSGWQCSWG